MGHANIYIRPENEETWQKLEKKSEFVNNALTDFTMNVGSDKGPLQVTPPIVTLKDIAAKVPTVETSAVLDRVVIRAAASQERIKNGLCKIHGTPLDGRKRCMVKGCKNG
jgi:hypothetical protein